MITPSLLTRPLKELIALCEPHEERPCFKHYLALLEPYATIQEAADSDLGNDVQAMLAYTFAINFWDGRCEELEPIIAKSARYSAWYAKWVAKGRFHLAEPAISRNPYAKVYYDNYVIDEHCPGQRGWDLEALSAPRK